MTRSVIPSRGSGEGSRPRPLRTRLTGHRKTVELLNMAVTRNRFIVDDKGHRVSVVLPVDEYEELLEDLHDLAVVAERRCEPTTTVPATRDRKTH